MKHFTLSVEKYTSLPLTKAFFLSCFRVSMDSTSILFRVPPSLQSWDPDNLSQKYAVEVQRLGAGRVSNISSFMTPSIQSCTKFNSILYHRVSAPPLKLKRRSDLLAMFQLVVHHEQICRLDKGAWPLNWYPSNTNSDTGKTIIYLSLPRHLHLHLCYPSTTFHSQSGL